MGTDLTGKTVMVTDAEGILRDMFAGTPARTGVAAALLNINLGAAEKIAKDIREAGEAAAAYGAGVMDKDILEGVHAGMSARLEPCNILMNRAGGGQARVSVSGEYFEMGGIEADMTTFFDMEYKEVQGVLSLNFLGGFLTCQVFAKDMVGQEGYSIINISSASATRPLTRIPIYSGAVAILSNFTQWLVAHLAKTGIRVNAIVPGFFVTRQNEGLLYKENGEPVTRATKVLAATSMGRSDRPEELNGTPIFLFSSEAAGFIIRIILPVDGGFSAYSGA